jgi:hypothetical protein
MASSLETQLPQLKRTYPLPFGFAATFAWNDGHLVVEWNPDEPRIRKPRAWRKFFGAYKAARRDFYTDLAAMIDGNILIVDTDLQKIDGMEVIAAPVKQ